MAAANKRDSQPLCIFTTLFGLPSGAGDPNISQVVRNESGHAKNRIKRTKGSDITLSNLALDDGLFGCGRIAEGKLLRRP